MADSTHGGSRKGAGRPPINGGGITVAVVLTPKHLGQIALWQAERGLKNRSEALRQMIDMADTTARLTRAYVENATQPPPNPTNAPGAARSA